MRTSDVASIFSRYPCLDFTELPGFLDLLPTNEYLLRNGPKFNGEDLSLTLKHIYNFREFIELLRVKHEDVFTTLFMIHYKERVKLGLNILRLSQLDH